MYYYKILLILKRNTDWLFICNEASDTQSSNNATGQW